MDWEWNQWPCYFIIMNRGGKRLNATKFSVARLLLYFVLVSVFLFVSGNVGQYVIENHDVDKQLGMLLQGMIFTGLTMIVLYILNRKHPGYLKYIGLKRARVSPRLIVGIILPLALLSSGILTAYLFGGIDNVSLNLEPTVLIAILINTVTAFLYEAFPEEVFIRGMIFEELNKKFRFALSLFLQPLIFICVPLLVTVLNFIFFQYPIELTIDYFMLLIAFGIALQLYRTYTGTLWMSIFFHLVYLEVTRYISMGGTYNPGITLLEFDEAFEGYMALYLSFLFMVLLSIVVLSVLLVTSKKKNRIQ